jgi:hypothetical protein
VVDSDSERRPEKEPHDLIFLSSEESLKVGGINTTASPQQAFYICETPMTYVMKGISHVIAAYAFS